jgi:hypothetical protein
MAHFGPLESCKIQRLPEQVRLFKVSAITLLDTRLGAIHGRGAKKQNKGFRFIWLTGPPKKQKHAKPH